MTDEKTWEARCHRHVVVDDDSDQDIVMTDIIAKTADMAGHVVEQRLISAGHNLEEWSVLLCGVSEPPSVTQEEWDALDEISKHIDACRARHRAIREKLGLPPLSDEASEARAPALGPDVLAGAKHDAVHRDTGKARAGRTVRTKGRV